MWKYPKPESWQLFEQILADWVQQELGDTGADRYGRSGQPQWGIDILACNRRNTSAGVQAEVWAIQAKRYDEVLLTPGTAQADFDRAMVHSPSPDVFVLATTTPRDTRLQDWAILASQGRHPTRVEVWFWDGLVERLLKESWFREKYLPTFWQRRIPYQLPSPVADFTGRDDEVATLLTRTTQGNNTIVLSGTGGVGKTALALMLASQLTKDCPDGQLRVDLHGTDSKKMVSKREAMHRIIRSIDSNTATLTSEDEIPEVYHSVLKERRVLILADDARGLAQVEALRPHPNSYLLITSRQRMAISGGYMHHVRELSNASGSLLLQRICPRVEHDATEIAELCGGLPLALRLVGSALVERIDLAVEQYVEQLRDKRTRLAFIDATIELSYQLLSDELRSSWRMLSVFYAPFDSVAAAAVLNKSSRVTSDLVGGLLKHSMIDWDSAAERYAIHELLRLAATSRLSDIEEEQARLHHAEHYERLLRSLKASYRNGNDATVEALQRFDLDRAQVEGAVGWLREKSKQSDQHRRLLSSYLDAGVDILPLRLAPFELVDWLNDAITATKALKDEGALIAHTGNLGVALERTGDYAAAVRVQESLLSLHRTTGDALGITKTLGNLATLHLHLNDNAKALTLATESLGLEQQIGNKKGMAVDLNTLGAAYSRLEQYEKALPLYAQSLKLKQELGDRFGEATTFAGIGQTCLAMKQLELAVKFFSASVKIFRELCYKVGEDQARDGLCLTLLHTGHLKRLTETQLAQVLGGGPNTQGRDLMRKILPYFQEALTQAKNEGKYTEHAAMLGDIATYYGALGESEISLGLQDESIAAAHACGATQIEANSLFNKAIVLAELGRKDEGMVSMDAARVLYKTLGVPDVKDAEEGLARFRSSPTRVFGVDTTTLGKASGRIGRNEPCPCGSGKKFKVCCLGK